MERARMICDTMVSVIIPIYNVSQYLEKCISSVIRQTYDRLQIILVNDGSTDHSGLICDRYKKMDKRIHVIHKQNEGLVQARKTGLALAEGEYICYVDGDDWIEPDMIECLMAGMVQTGTELVISNHFCDMGNYVWKVKEIQRPGVYRTADLVPIMLYTGIFYEFGISQFVWAKLFRKDLLWDIQMQADQRISCGEDVAVTYPYILKTHKVCFLDFAGYHYLQRAGSITSCYDAEEQTKNRILLKYLQNIFNRSIYSESLLGQLNQYAKNLLLIRQTGCFDYSIKDKVLMIFGGIPREANVIIYGAGKLGQSLYNYLEHQTSVKITNWVDKNYKMYQELHMKVNSIEELKTQDSGTYDFILIGINNQKTAEKIKKNLLSINIEQEKIKWLSKDFIKL